jgi:hypothetical protein
MGKVGTTIRELASPRVSEGLQEETTGIFKSPMACYHSRSLR